MAFCTGCSLLCDDIEAEFEGGKVKRTMNLCRKGRAHYDSLSIDRLTPAVGGSEVRGEEAVTAAGELLAGAERPLLLGFGRSTLEAQKLGIELAKKLGSVIDDPTSRQGLIMERILKGEVPTCTFDDVRNYADVSIYWGDDPSSSHPRHLSRFSYFPRGEKRQRGYEEDREAIVIDVRRSPTATIAADGFFQVSPGGDAAFAEALLAALGGKIPKVEDKKRMLNLATKLRKAKFGAIFTGPGLADAQDGDLGWFFSLVARLNELTRFSVIPSLPDYNTRGLHQALFDVAGAVSPVSFEGGIASGPKFGVPGLLESFDAVLVVGSDPVANLPAPLARKLARIPMVAVGTHRNLTTDAASVTVPTAMAGLEAGGSALRSDGVRVDLEAQVKSDRPTDLQIVEMLMEVV
jgi:formylmethanofuran dehydrogenase subunit B